MKVVTFGEIMLRLKSPGYDRLFQSPVLEATFGGVCAGCFGCWHRSRLIHIQAP